MPPPNRDECMTTGLAERLQRVLGRYVEPNLAMSLDDAGALEAVKAGPDGPVARIVLGFPVGGYEDSLRQALDSELAAAGIEARLGPLGLEPDGRPFHAHLTLARFRRHDRRIAKAVKRAVEGLALDAGEWPVDHATLYESKLSPKGSTYIPVERVELSQ